MSAIDPVSSMAEELTKLPGIGQKTAQRLAYHIAQMSLDDVHSLASAIWNGRKAIRYCSICGNYSSGDVCDICSNQERHNGQVCVVRDPRDVAAMERMHDYHGLYHVLHGTLSPMNGIRPKDIRIQELLDRTESENISEVIIATNPDVEGEATANYLARLLKEKGIKCTRIAHGLPVGSDLEYADEVTLYHAMEGRREM